MTFKINMEQDGILRIHLEGDLNHGNVESFKREHMPYVEASTSDLPLKSILFVQHLGRLSSSARQYLTDLNKDPRYGFAAYVQPSRRARVLGQFITKATGRDNIKYFNNETEALTWMKSSRATNISSS